MSEARLLVSVASQPNAGVRIFGPVGPWNSSQEYSAIKIKEQAGTAFSFDSPPVHSSSFEFVRSETWLCSCTLRFHKLFWPKSWQFGRFGAHLILKQLCAKLSQAPVLQDWLFSKLSCNFKQFGTLLFSSMLLPNLCWPPLLSFGWWTNYNFKQAETL